MTNEIIDTEYELFKTSLVRLKEIYRKRKDDFLKDWERSLKEEEKNLRKKFKFKESVTESLQAPEKNGKKQRKNGRNKGRKRGELKPAVMNAANDLKSEKKPFTISAILGVLEHHGVSATRQQVYLIIHREVGRTFRIRRSGKGKGTETIFEFLEEKKEGEAR